MNPGPAISTFSSSALSGSAATSLSARSLGRLRAGLASTIATLHAKSPWRVSRARSMMGWGICSGAMMPSTAIFSRAWETNCCIWVFILLNVEEIKAR